MTYSNDFLLFYAYGFAVFGALLVSALTLTADAACGSFRQWRLKRKRQAGPELGAGPKSALPHRT